jgi:hypothetical protein
MTDGGGRVTRDVEPDALRGLLQAPPRAMVGFVRDGLPDLLPVVVRVADEHRFGVTPTAPDLDGREVVLLVDDGPYWFQLRGVSVRGRARRVPDPPGATHLAWYVVEARRVLAWDYGALRET